ncbi:MAG: repair protein RadA [Ilumatobacteraceae bacterium]|jgi:DNA repair protein RadA/Sms|nr:repair protein RadA [Ilumatobacteraceae bacterium]
MAKARVVYRCNDCGTTHPKWGGRCPACNAWNTLIEDVEGPDPATVLALAHGPSAMPTLLGDVDALVGRPQPTGIAEIDRVLGGGLVPGSVTLLGGEPGIGKSTLLTQLLARWPGRTLYVSAEESAQQVRLRAERLGAAANPALWLLPETSLPHIVAAIDQVQPTLVVVDSIQAIADPELGSAPGSIVQVRGCAHRLVAEAKQRGVPMILVGHVTKDGGLAGPRVLEHVVDTVLSFEGDRHHALRLLRAVKHRFGSTNELGVFEMVEEGLVGVPDASRLFLTDRRAGVAGSAVTPTLDGHRPLLVEVQALTNVVTSGAPPRRSAQGLDPGRLALLLAVLERRAQVPMAQQEVFASAVGGVRLTEPGADLAVCLAVASAQADIPLPPDVVLFGEVGLAGELRQASHAPRRLAEAARMGFAHALVPANTPEVAGIRLIRAATIVEALTAVGLRRGRRAGAER